MTQEEAKLAARLAAATHTLSLLLAMKLATMSPRDIEAVGEILVYPYAAMPDAELAAMSEIERLLRSERQDAAEHIFGEAKRLAIHFRSA